MKNFCIYVIMSICILMILFCVFKIGENVGKAQIIKEVLTKIPIESISQAQKELTDFANKQREFYKKTHNGY